MKVVVVNQHTAEELCKNEHKKSSIMISISSTYADKPNVFCSNKNNIVDILELKFNDTESTNPTYNGIKQEHAKQIKEFVNKYKDNNTIELLTVHCFLGQSRSVGVAAAIMEYLHIDNSILLNNKTYNPNMLCYNTVLNELTK